MTCFCKFYYKILLLDFIDIRINKFIIVLKRACLGNLFCKLKRKMSFKYPPSTISRQFFYLAHSPGIFEGVVVTACVKEARLHQLVQFQSCFLTVLPV